MKPATFRPESQIELTEAARFYEAQVVGLGDAFLNAVEQAVADIREHPARWPVIARHIRKRAIGRFPYAVLYRDMPEEVVIVAVMHLHRRPKYWIKRSQA